MDGGRGDGDGLANGVVVDPGGPTYELDEYLLTVAVSGGGSVSEATGIHPAGSVVTPTATADAGWSFSGWSGALTGATATQSLTLDQDKTVTAIFTQDQYTLARRVVGSGSVAISPNQGSYVYGDVVAATATPDTGWTLSGWSGDLSGSTAGENVTMDSSKVITATFTQNQYTLNTGVTGNGSVVLNPDQATYVHGDVVSVQAVPDPGYAFQSWSGDLSGSGSGQNLIVNGNKSVTALFVTASYTVETSSVGSGSIVLDPDQATYAYGDVISVSAAPAADWHLAEWQVGLSGATATQLLTITESVNLVALFEPDTYSLNIGWIGDGAVSVDPVSEQYVVGEVVTITAVPDTGFTFKGWREETSDIIFSTSLTTTVTMTGNKSIIAHFTPPLYSVTTNIVGSGTVMPTGLSYTLGETAEFTATATSGWTFDGWSGDVVSTTNPITMTIDADKVITATFTTNSPTHTLTTYTIGNGAVTPVSGIHIAGTVVPVTATAGAGWAFSGWSGDVVSTANPLAVIMDADKVITGTFTIDTDSDSIGDIIEEGAPNNGDGNNDGTPDSQQSFIVSLPDAVTGDYLTLVGSDGMSFTNVSVSSSPPGGSAPDGFVFPIGFVDFTLQGMNAGAAVSVTLLSENSASFSTYYKYGPTPDNTTNHWYEFLFDGTTGAEILSDRIILHFVDGQRGDHDLSENGVVEDPGGAADIDINASYEIDKRLMGTGPFRIGKTITFTISITNNGAVPLTKLPLSDLYDNTYISFIASNPPADDAIDDGELTWSDLVAGTAGLAPGDSLPVEVEFWTNSDTTGLLTPQSPCSAIGQTCNVALVDGAIADPGNGQTLQSLGTQQAWVDVHIVSPTAVQLTNWRVDYLGGHVTLFWETVDESNIIAFNIYRRTGEEETVKLTEHPLVASRAGQSAGASYSYVDEDVRFGESYDYRLEIIRANQSTEQMPLGSVVAQEELYLPMMIR